MMCKYPNIEVKLIGRDGNAFMILGQVQRAMKKANIPQGEIEIYLEEAMSGDYDHLLATTCNYVSVE